MLNGGSSTSTGSLESYGSLETIINPPLETGKGTDHNNSCVKTSPETSETDLSVNLANVGEETSLALGIINL